MPEAPKVWVFFYGSYINRDVLAELDFVPGDVEVASLAGFDLRIRPLANLVRSEEHTVFGINTRATHAELERFYRHAEHVLGDVYLPEAVLTRTREDLVRPALAYVSPNRSDEPADPAYVARIAGPAREYGFPSWYLDRIESFLP